ncbi:hypothetical protein AB832_08285 [Flavobacteriaceae bacterium (ex Bugula neritina AB1)]|jgi:hypothetical protein|nr:hypothetical protein AB832_08285 [Flavobacteriaceae bacterium (ex Bugula neritina AB1)]
MGKGRKPLPYKTKLKRVPVNLFGAIDDLIRDFKKEGQKEFSFVNNRQLTFNLDFVKLGYGIKGAIWLSHSVLLQNNMGDKTGWFYASVSDFEKETGLTTREQRTIKTKLKEDKILNTKKKGIPSKTYLKINVKKLYNELSKVTGDNNE